MSSHETSRSDLLVTESCLLALTFVDYLCFLIGPVQLLNMMANCGKIQTAVRRDEKKLLNAAYKLIKYKFEGPQSKIRIQSSQQKAFVMLQSAVSGHYFDDFTLRQQIVEVVNNSSQILSACEQYALEGSKHG